ncbi:MAG: hypothetical protein ACR2N3_04705 [Pyrinomonadaceae bacterium]
MAISEGEYQSLPDSIQSGQTHGLELDANGNLKVNVASGSISTTPNPSVGTTGSTLPTSATYIGGKYGSNITGARMAGDLGDADTGSGIFAFLQYQSNGAGNFDAVRTVKVFKPLTAVSIAAEAAVWTPAAGKKFRLMGGVITTSVAGNITFKDNTAGTTIMVVPVTAGVPVVIPPMGNGILSAAANNVLTAIGPAASTFSGTLFGTEE